MARLRFKSRGSKPAGIVGKLFITLFLGAFLCGGLFFFWLLSKEIWQTVQTYRWPSVECRILGSQVRERSNSSEQPYEVRVSYEYSWEGQTYASEQVALKLKAYGSYRKAQRWVDRYVEGSSAACFVNPQDPSQAILVRDHFWIAFFLVIPLVFILVGGGGVATVWLAKWEDSGESPEKVDPKESISQKGKGGKGRRVLRVFSWVFLLAGCGFTYVFLVSPIFKILGARDWVETICVVESSRLQSHRSDDGTTYSIDILYRYTVNGRDYKSNRYKFMGGSSSGTKGKRAVLRRYPVGKEAICFVNPNDPTDAVLVRGFTADLWLGLIPLVFLVAGGVGLLASIGKLRWKKTGGIGEANAARQPEMFRHRSADGAEIDEGPVELKVRVSRWGKLVGMIFFATFWNGIVSVFVWQVIKAWQQSKSGFMEKWFLPIFLIPFVLVGLVLIFAVFQNLLALFNPRIRLTVSSGRLVPGEHMDLQWRMMGRVYLLQNLRIYLEGREEATYRRGTRTYTDKEVFATVDLTETKRRSDIRAGQTRVTLPSLTVPSFEAPHNKIIWTIRVKGEIKRWPDVDDEFPIQVVMPPNIKPTRS